MGVGTESGNPLGPYPLPSLETPPLPLAISPTSRLPLPVSIFETHTTGGPNRPHSPFQSSIPHPTPTLAGSSPPPRAAARSRRRRRRMASADPFLAASSPAHLLPEPSAPPRRPGPPRPLRGPRALLDGISRPLVRSPPSPRSLEPNRWVCSCAARSRSESPPRVLLFFFPPHPLFFLSSFFFRIIL